MSQDTTDQSLEELERKYDPDLTFRAAGPVLAVVITAALVAMSLYHYYASGFGLIRELVHRGIHLSFVLGLVFVLFSFIKSTSSQPAPSAWWRPSGVHLWDIVLAVMAVAAAMYLPLLPAEAVASRVGAPAPIDVFMGTVLLVLVLEAARRSVGPTLPLIALIFVGYAVFGMYAPGALRHPGASWTGLINHLYMTNQGIYGIAIGVVAKYVFLFVLFGVLATRIGLGQLFIDLASVIAGRYAGGPAKVAIFSSAMLGTISGSSIANTVTTGSLTIPAMKKVGYPPHFAGAVEATASTGGQITPPIMGAAAFIMVEFLEIPYREVLLAAMFPAMLHYFGIFVMVHLEAKRLGLRGLTKDELPKALVVMKQHWLSVIPLGILVYLIISGKTPDFAAVWGITACVVVGILNPHNRMGIKDLIESLATGAKYSLAVGAAAAAVGIIVGVVTLTGTGFRLSFVVTQAASDLGGFIASGMLAEYVTQNGLTLFFTLLFTAVACIIMGAGIPTTATYIILVSIAAPALALLGVQPLVAHFFVFYYGVLADITPPVALAAYAGAGIAGANPFKTGNTAFRLGIAKALVPFVFVYSPALLLVTPEFTWYDLTVTLAGAMCGIGLLGVAFSGYMLAGLNKLERYWTAFAAMFFVAPGLQTMAIGGALMLPVVVRQVMARKNQQLMTQDA
ncbi:TRAP transporter, 4TM/12TM fusion protein [Pseudovibrio ascidiaceicola]|jgi:TRAP transporter 4TM/12TM fusion protein|uniref:TRAP transporter, 4TM/12TM fusion protein n=1 Tax=Pseudovibrio ascidiaceicola TaxID=285279 RepID=A0A1I3Y4M8_9HYPH|nr:TRAP transporter permease [Pseudovibrio ascidiaceicola]SFK26814.1 TRAP transporter, 4TM/12TM fusion protein [Pseudovibrio ascidiaceicola]